MIIRAMNFFRIIILLVMISCSNIIMANESQIKFYEDYPIHYSKNNFINIVDSLNLKPLNIDTCNINEIIFLIRVYNTIGNYIVYLHENKSMMSFVDYFLSNYSEEVVIRLSASLSRGFGYYSKEYDIYIGGSHLNDRSFFIIKELDKLKDKDNISN